MNWQEAVEKTVTGLGYENVSGFYVAVNDTSAVRGLKTLRDFFAEFEELVHWQRPTRDAVAQRFAFEQFHDDEELAVLMGNFVDGADVRVIERGGGARLALKSLQSGRVRIKLRR